METGKTRHSPGSRDPEREREKELEERAARRERRSDADKDRAKNEREEATGIHSEIANHPKTIRPGVPPLAPAPAPSLSFRRFP